MLQLVPDAMFPPNACVNCGTDRGPFIWLDSPAQVHVQTETGLRPIEGSIYLCTGDPDPAMGRGGCAREIAELLGFVPPERHANLAGQLNEARAEIGALDGRAQELERRLVQVG